MAEKNFDGRGCAGPRHDYEPIVRRVNSRVQVHHSAVTEWDDRPVGLVGLREPATQRSRSQLLCYPAIGTGAARQVAGASDETVTEEIDLSSAPAKLRRRD